MNRLDNICETLGNVLFALFNRVKRFEMTVDVSREIMASLALALVATNE